MSSYNSNSPNIGGMNPNYPYQPGMNPNYQYPPGMNPNYPLQPGMNPNYPLQPGMNPNYSFHSGMNPNNSFHSGMNPYPGGPPPTFPLAAGGNYPYQPGIPQYNTNPNFGQMPPPHLNYSNPNFNPNNSFGPPMGYGDVPHPLSHYSSFSGPQMGTHPAYIQDTTNQANFVQENNQNEEFLRYQMKMREIEEKKQMEEQTRQIKKALDMTEEAFKKEESREERNRKRVLRFRSGNLYNPPIKIYVPRSDYFYERDRYFIEQLIMQPLKVNGAIGTRLVDDFDKSILIGEQEQEKSVVSYIHNNEEEYFEKSVKDGIYLDYIKQLIYSFNIQKIEQRAAREGKKDWFTSNGDLRMDNDIFSDIITKPTDITLTANERFNTFYGNSSFSGRNNEAMLKTYKLRLIVSKIVFTKHPFFNKEEQLNSELRELHRDFYKHMNMLNIPYLKDKISTITTKLDEYSRKKLLTESEKIDKKNMRIFLDESTEILKKEKDILNKKANALYDKWLELKHLRIEQKYQSTRSKLNVIRFNCDSDNPNIFDYAFILTNHDVSGDHEVVPRSEFDRRDKIRTNTCYLKIFINGIFALETKSSNFGWPSFEVEFNNLFIINLYTRPTKMEVEVYVNKELVSKFEAEPPGIFSKTVTSSSALMEEIEFGKAKPIKEKPQQQEVYNNHIQMNSQQLSNQDDEGEKLLNNNSVPNEQPQEKEKELNSNVEGRLIIKTEWEGLAPDLPPTKIEDKLELVNKQIEFKEEIKIYNKNDYPFDVNDPRNVAFVEELRKDRRELMLKYFYKEYLLKYEDVISLRHSLLLERLKKKSLSNFTFPILEHEIERDPRAKEILDQLRKEEEQSFITQEELTRLTKDELLKLVREESANMSKDKIARLSKEEIISMIEKKQFELKTKEEIERLQQEYSGRALSHEEYTEFLKRKVKIMRKDVTHQNQYNYFQIISEAEIYDDPVLLIKEFFIRVFSRARKLAPLKIKPPPVKTESIKSFKINIHVVKGFNLPIRITSLSAEEVEKKRLETVNEKKNTIAQLSQLDKKVISFIEVKIVFYEQVGVFRTDAVEGIHPDYNYQIKYEITPRQGESCFTTKDLAKCPGVFYFTVYDEIREDKVNLGRDANTFIQRFEKKYLGSFSIPFSTVFQNASILDTICKIDIPKFVFGYYSDMSSLYEVTSFYKTDADAEAEAKKQEEKKEQQQRSMEYEQFYEREDKRFVNPFVHSYVSLYITLDPIPSFSKNDDLDYVPGYEDSIFLINATKWLKSIKEKAMFKNRNIRLFAENFDGCSVFMPRFLKREGEEPPKLFLNENIEGNNLGDEYSIDQISHYVALIPFIEDSQTFDFAEEMPDCWCTNNQFLTLGFGDYEEHAVLLCNYFNYIDNKENTGCVSYLALGEAHPEGLTIYVMRITKDNKSVEFWNAKTGECFFFDKTVEYNKFLCLTVSKNFKHTKANSNQICPLKSVGSIITFDNVYVNIQSKSDPGLIDFDLNNKSNWMKFLTEDSMKKYFPNGITSIQKDPIIYTEGNELEGNTLKEAIKEYLKNEVEKVRGEILSNNEPLRTNWDNTVEHGIENILREYDTFCFRSRKSRINFPDNNIFGKEQNELLEQHIKFERRIKTQFGTLEKIYGFPINVPFTTMKEVWERVKLTNVHLVSGMNTELSLSVFVHSLPSNIYSVWIFFAIITRSRFFN